LNHWSVAITNNGPVLTDKNKGAVKEELIYIVNDSRRSVVGVRARTLLTLPPG
jgi:hypothetical protein